MTGIPILSREPESIVAGDTIKWKRSLSDFPASTWTLTYELRSNVTGSTAINIAATADGDDHLVSVSATTTAAWIAGEYSWDAYVTAGAERKRVDRGLIKVERDLAGAVAAFDDRDWVKTVLDALEAVIQGRASEVDLSYSVNGRSISKMSWEEKIKAHSHFKKLYQQELTALKLEKGLGTGNKIRTRFTAWQ